MDETEKKILSIIDGHRKQIVGFARDIFAHAELGYGEIRTAGKFSAWLGALGVRVEEGVAVTGVKGYWGGPESGITLALIGELDALHLPGHPDANPENGAAHACGHHAQLAGVAGAALALTDPDVAKTLGGRVVFLAAPAEEAVSARTVDRLRAEGKIRYASGKCEMIRIGAFDDIDLAVVHHSIGDGILVGCGTTDGFIPKTVRFIGRASHAGMAPEDGVNALNAAALTVSAIAYQRETFRDEDMVRVHPILTSGGTAVNIVPAEAVMELATRANNVRAMLGADKKVERAVRAAAMAVGAGFEMTTTPGNLPGKPEPADPAVLEAAREAAPEYRVEAVAPGAHDASSSDVNDLQQLLPVLTFETGGTAGAFHTTDFHVVDENEAYLATAKIFALSAYKLLKNGAETAKKIKERYRPAFTREEYVRLMESLFRRERREIAIE